MKSARVWIYRVLILASIALFITSWLIPWWRSNIQEAGMFTQIRPWGLEHNLGSYTEYMGGDPSLPFIFTILMWLYLALAIGALLLGAFMRERSLSIYPFDFSVPQWLIAAGGISYIVFILVFLVVAYVRTAGFGVVLKGVTYIVVPEFHLGAEAISDFEPGFYLACITGPLLVVLAALRGMVIGRPKSKSQE
jgi:hypothetical protein